MKFIVVIPARFESSRLPGKPLIDINGKTLLERQIIALQKNDINDIVPSSHRSSDLDGRKPNLVISLYADSYTAISQTFNQWYTSADTTDVSHWQKQIASSETILQANQLVEYWLSQADLLVPLMPNELRAVAEGLVASVKQCCSLTLAQFLVFSRQKIKAHGHRSDG